jgi:arginine/lysine/ornithine decarboxylase
MQMDMEGHDKIAKALAISEYIRYRLEGSRLQPLSSEDLGVADVSSEPSGGALDPLKMTVRTQNFMSGIDLRAQLHEQFAIQLNKYSHNTCLLLLTIGTTWEMAEHLVGALKRVEEQMSMVPLERLKMMPALPRFGGFRAEYQAGDQHCGYLRAAHSDAIRAETVLVDALEAEGRTSAAFVTPYPPGWPILVPGQVIGGDVIVYIEALGRLGVRSIHGVDESGKFLVLDR